MYVRYTRKKSGNKQRAAADGVSGSINAERVLSARGRAILLAWRARKQKRTVVHTAIIMPARYFETIKKKKDDDFEVFRHRRFFFAVEGMIFFFLFSSVYSMIKGQRWVLDSNRSVANTRR